MYTAYWQLSRRPFETGLDLTAYYPSETHQSSLLKLRYALEHGGGIAVLGGAAGTGKTLLVKLLAQRLGTKFTPWVHVVFPQLSTSELLAYLAAEITSIDDLTLGLDRILRRIGQAVTTNAAQGQRAVLIIDEAQLLAGPDTLETLRLLLNFEHEGRPAISLLLVGQPALLAQLERSPQFDERVMVKCLLRPLTCDETMSYVQHRLAQAGARQAIFAPAALEALHRQSQGVPRRINRLADLALLVGFAEEQPLVQERHIETVAQEFVELAA